MNLSSIWQFFLFHLRPFQRDKAGVLFMVLFPVLSAVVFAAAFDDSSADDPPITVAFDRARPISKSWEDAMRATPAITITELTLAPELAAELSDRPEHSAALLNGPLTQIGADLLLWPDQVFSLASPSETAQRTRRLMELRERAEGRALTASVVSQNGRRMIDWMIPGLIGLMLFNLGFVGVASRLAQDREGGLFKRLRLTPYSSVSFIVGFSLSRLVIVAFEIAALLAMFHFVYGFQVQGSLLIFVAAALLGSLTFCLLGSAISARMRSAQTAMALSNVLYLILMFLSGVYFEVSRFPAPVAAALEFSPLTALNKMLRIAANSPSFSLVSVEMPALVLTAWAVLALFVTVTCFDWGAE